MSEEEESVEAASCVRGAEPGLNDEADASGRASTREGLVDDTDGEEDDEREEDDGLGVDIV